MWSGDLVPRSHALQSNKQQELDGLRRNVTHRPELGNTPEHLQEAEANPLCVFGAGGEACLLPCAMHRRRRHAAC